MRNRAPRILIFAPTVKGGIAEYIRLQAVALQDLGAEVLCLVAPGFLEGKSLEFPSRVCLIPPPSTPAGLWRKIRFAWQIIANRYLLAWQVVRHRPDLVLLDSYSEYLAPLWIDPHILLSRIIGIPYAANLHDPVRSHRIGPAWWHRLSVWLAYEPLRFVLVHQEPQDPTVVPKRVRVVQVPHGLYEFPCSAESRLASRRAWGIPPEAQLFLSFGFVRDGKNLDLVIEALVDVPEAYLVVMGTVATSSDRPFSWYRDQARRLGVEGRCRLIEGYVSEESLGDVFSASDFVLLTYGSEFHSQSGVLNMAAHARKPILASASPSPMLDSVRTYKLGVAVEPDSINAIAAGMKDLIRGIPEPDWEAYASQASWKTNARRILQEAALPSSSES